MFQKIHTLAFILKEEPRGEADKILTVFSKDFGKMEIRAKSVRKIDSKLKSGIKLFSLVDVEFVQGEKQKTLTDILMLSDFGRLRQSLGKMNVACAISDLLDKMVISSEKDEKIWRLLSRSFFWLDSAKEKEKFWLAYYYLFWNLLARLGYEPELKVCSVCRKKLAPSSLFFKRKQGVVCGLCGKIASGEVVSVSQNTIKVLRLLLKEKPSFLRKIKLDKNIFLELQEISKVSEARPRTL